MSLPVIIGCCVAFLLCIVTPVSLNWLIFSRRRKYPFVVKGSHCLITGGSSGLGLAIAELLVRGGASVTIVARRKEQLESAVQKLRKLVLSNDQSVEFLSIDVTNVEQVKGMFKQAEEKSSSAISGCKPVNYLFICAGASQPAYFTDLDYKGTCESFSRAINLNYLASAYCSRAAIEYWSSISDRSEGGFHPGKKIVFTSSTLGLMNIVGYAQYAPTKHALRSLAECLRQESHIWANERNLNVDIHIYYVSTIDTPGFKEEEKTKPALTREIEGAESSDCSPEARAKSLLKGLSANQFAITSDLITDLFRSSSVSTIPGRFWDVLVNPIAVMAIVVWRWTVEWTIITYKSDGAGKGKPTKLEE